MKSRRFCLLLIAVLVISITGCIIGPRYQPPCLPIQDEWIDSDEPAISLAPYDGTDWWKVFHDPVLNELINIAYAQNLDLEAAGLRVYEAYASLGIAIGQYYPQFQQFQAGQSYNRLSRNVANSPGVFKFRDYFLQFVVSWEVDLWGKFSQGIFAAESILNSEIYSYRDVMVSLVANIADAYVAITGFNKKIRLLEDNVKLQERTLAIVETRFKLGQSTGLDLEQAKSNLDVTKATLESQVLSRRQAENTLCLLLGVAPFRLQGCIDIGDEVLQPPNQLEVGMPIDLVRDRPDVRAAEEQAIAQCYGVGVAETELLPAFSLNGLFGWESMPKWRSLLPLSICKKP